MSPSCQPWLNESLCWRKRYCQCILSPCAVICHLLSWSEGPCLSLPRWSWTSPPNLPGLPVQRTQFRLPVHPGHQLCPAMTGEKTLMKLTPCQETDGRGAFYKMLAHLTPLMEFMKFRETSCPTHYEMKAVLHPSSKKTNWDIPGTISG